jgi:hypothetical protein
MLIYVRKKDRHMYLEPCTLEDIPQELTQRFRKDKEEKERKIRGTKKRAGSITYPLIEKEEQRWLVSLDLVFDNDIIGNTINDLCTEPIKSIKVHKTREEGKWEITRLWRPNSFQVRKDYKFESIHGVIEKEYGIPADKQRIWKWIRRQNRTLRPNSRPIPPHKADK